ncbi:MAG: hypothetical protein ABI807_05055 [Sporichthyaceae bacterium]
MVRPDHPLLAGLVDDAALFPPGNAPMAQAVLDHHERAFEPWAGAVGVFVCPAARVRELVSAMAPSQTVLVSLVVDPAVPGLYDAVRAADSAERVAVVGIEAPLERLGPDGARVLAEDLLGFGVETGPHTGYLEVPRASPDSALDMVRTTGWHSAKYRTGGVTADAHPDETELAHFLVGCRERGLDFKLTAGLHHAVRGTTPEGFEQHGVLNVLLAVAAAARGADRREVATVLAERDGRLLAKEARSWTRAEAAQVRQQFRSFGCCAVAEPLDELRTLGVLEDDEEGP